MAAILSRPHSRTSASPMTFPAAFPALALCLVLGPRAAPLTDEEPVEVDIAKLVSITYEQGKPLPKEIQELGTENPQTLTAMTASNPRHEVQVEPFYLDTHEVTNRQWKVFLDATGRKPNEDLVKYVWTDGKIPAGKEDLPAVCVSYQEAIAYCRWAGKRLHLRIGIAASEMRIGARLALVGDFLRSTAHDLLRIWRARARSAGVSTPRGTVSTRAT